MTEENEELNHEAAVSEQSGEAQDGGTHETVPLGVVIATRKRAQESEARANRAEAQVQAYEALLNKMQAGKQEPIEDEDPQGLVERKDLYENTVNTKREILETLYQDMNPEAVQKINKYLKPILEKKPWLASSVDTAQNRYARAYEIVQDYIHLVEEKTMTKAPGNTDGRRIIENAQKPRSPSEVGKSARPEGVEYLKSIQGKKEFRDYRQKVLRGEA